MVNDAGPPEPAWLGALDPDAESPLGRHSVLRRVVAEPVTALMIQRALVMDVAHPKVAAGVEDHSQFRSHPWRRAWVTVDTGLRLVFGSTADGPGRGPPDLRHPRPHQRALNGPSTGRAPDDGAFRLTASTRLTTPPC